MEPGHCHAPFSHTFSVNHHPLHMIKKLSSIVSVGALSLAASFGTARAADTVKVGVLHSLSGTMAISETSLRDILLFTFDEINAKGGVMGKKIEPVIVDGASN
jgi:urea transport system substrate-binding protein